MIINADLNKEFLIKKVDNRFKDAFHRNGEVTSVMIINASDNPANDRYIQKKKELLDRFGVRCFVKHIPPGWRNEEVREYIREKQKDFTAVMIQSPVYSHMDYERLIDVVDYRKDIDGLHPTNQGKLYSNHRNAIIPCTALGAFNLMMFNNVNIWNNKVVIIGRGKLVADPLAKMLENHDCTVTKIHSKSCSEYTKKLIKEADIIVSCVGKDLSHMINPETVSKDLQALIGVGFRYEDRKQLQDFKVNDDWNENTKITSNTNATGSATVYALIDNLIQIIENK